MAKIFVISDTHFGHDNIISFESHYRGHFKNSKEMDEFMIDMWNQTVSNEDTVYHLGDVAFKGSIDIVSKLNGHKVLIMGNHDNGVTTKKFEQVGFKEIYGMKKLNRKFFLTHCPMHPVEIGMYPNVMNIHGHIHSRLVFTKDLKPDARYVNVGVELTGFKPINLEEIYEFQRDTFNNKEIVNRALIKQQEDFKRCQIQL